jgi:hypothetical protein
MEQSATSLSVHGVKAQKPENSMPLPRVKVNGTAGQNEMIVPFWSVQRP